MVQVIERLEEAGGTDYIKFRVYRSHRGIRANWQCGQSEHRMGSIGTSLLGLDVETDFKRAYNEAVQYGVPFLLVEDPEGLFPPAKRPQIPV